MLRDGERREVGVERTSSSNGDVRRRNVRVLFGGRCLVLTIFGQAQPPAPSRCRHAMSIPLSMLCPALIHPFLYNNSLPNQRPISSIAVWYSGGILVMLTKNTSTIAGLLFY